jgi:hypothetical protein
MVPTIAYYGVCVVLDDTEQDLDDDTDRPGRPTAPTDCLYTR